jgi:hypothetical protein
MLSFIALMTSQATDGHLVNALEMKRNVLLEFIKENNERTCMI